MSDKEQLIEGPAKSVEGWIIIITGLHEETQQDDLYDTFSKFGQIKNLHLNLDRRTGFVKGYALIEFESREIADAAIKCTVWLTAEMNGEQIYEKKIKVDWAFKNAPPRKEKYRDKRRT